jgi:ribonuclease VapC
MFLDASAIIGIIAMEEDAASLAGRLAQARRPHTSAVAVFEAAAGLARIANAPAVDALALVERFLGEIGATTVMPIDQVVAGVAVAAFDRFGKGRHPAALNMGDCFAYACARQLDMTLLCKGNDFPHTDISLA